MQKRAQEEALQTKKVEAERVAEEEINAVAELGETKDLTQIEVQEVFDIDDI